ncbi:MAG TPA: signal peptidase I [Xanthomonadales bacterium]|nr:signal peptidase I [Xanthomonadales bacterium]
MGKLDLDFAALLVALSLFTGVVWAIDHFAFRKKRLARDPDAKEPVLVEYCRSFFPVIFAVLLIRSFLAEPFRIPSDSMMPTLLDGDFILVNKFAYGIRVPVVNKKVIDIGEPERGDVVVFRYPGYANRPDDPTIGTDYIKRIVGLPGDEVTYRDRILYVNGQKVDAKVVGAYNGISAARDYKNYATIEEHLGDVTHQALLGPPPLFANGEEGTWRVGQNEFLVIGDNRSNSEDGRYWGMVPEANLVGKAFLIWFNWDRRGGGGIQFRRIGTVIH